VAGSNAPPALTVSVNGVGAVSDAQLNSFMQSGALAANLRQFTGLNSMTAYLVGLTSQGDGGQGVFVFNSASTAADDGENVIAPSGSLQGRWLRQSGAGLMILFPTIAALRASTASPPPSTVVFVEGYYVGADGGEGLFWLDAADTSSADNSGTIIVDAAGNRWYRECNREVYNIHWFGVPISGDSTPALTAAFAALPTNGGRIGFKQQKYTFSSGMVTLTYPSAKPFSLTLEGAGQSSTTLYWAASNGLAINVSDQSHTIHIRDLSLTTGSPGTYNAVTVTQTGFSGSTPGNDFTNLTFEADYSGSNANFWSSGILISALSFVNYNGVIVYGANTTGVGIRVAGSSPNYAIEHNLQGCSFTGLSSGFEYGDYVQGVSMSQCNFESDSANGAHIFVLPSAAGVLSQLSVSLCQFGGSMGGNPITVESSLGDLHFDSNLVFVSTTSTAILVTTTGALVSSSIIGNDFSGLGGGTGIFVENNGTLGSGTSFGTTVIGNTFSDLTTGVVLGTGTTLFNVQANAYPNTPTKVTDNGSLNNVGTASP
jgi:hypothetical protein